MVSLTRKLRGKFHKKIDDNMHSRLVKDNIGRGLQDYLYKILIRDLNFQLETLINFPVTEQLKKDLNK